MELTTFLKSNFITDLHHKYKAVKKVKSAKSFNLFSVSSYNSYLENFHSDVIAALLNPKGNHQEGAVFLFKFIDYLNLHFELKIDKSNYEKVTVTREKGRVDIWIRDEKSKSSIIIENKINDAPDRDGQLKDYFDYAIKEKFKVDAVIYLSLDGLKKAPISNDDNVNKVVKNIGAFSNTISDLCSGWLQPCMGVCNLKNTDSFIYQYQNLIIHLSNTNMNNQMNEKFLEHIDDAENFEAAKAVTDLMQNLQIHRAERFRNAIGDNIKPFKSAYRYKPHYWILHNYREGDKNNFKLDISFKPDHSVRIDFWNTGIVETAPAQSVIDKLSSIKMFNEFEAGGHGEGMKKVFKPISDKGIKTIDDEVVGFVKKILEALRD